MKALAPILVLAALGTAPFQCASDPDPNKRREETPGEALYGLAESFHKSGDKAAQIRTLEFLVKRYPSSHEAEQAKADLRALGVVVPEETVEPPPSAPSASETPSSAAAPSASAAVE